VDPGRGYGDGPLDEFAGGAGEVDVAVAGVARVLRGEGRRAPDGFLGLVDRLARRHRERRTARLDDRGDAASLADVDHRGDHREDAPRRVPDLSAAGEDRRGLAGERGQAGATVDPHPDRSRQAVDPDDVPPRRRCAAVGADRMADHHPQGRVGVRQVGGAGGPADPELLGHAVVLVDRERAVPTGVDLHLQLALVEERRALGVLVPGQDAARPDVHDDLAGAGDVALLGGVGAGAPRVGPEVEPGVAGRQPHPLLRAAEVAGHRHHDDRRSPHVLQVVGVRHRIVLMVDHHGPGHRHARRMRGVRDGVEVRQERVAQPGVPQELGLVGTVLVDGPAGGGRALHRGVAVGVRPPDR
jgi:hypothetical protein